MLSNVWFHFSSAPLHVSDPHAVYKSFIIIIIFFTLISKDPEQCSNYWGGDPAPLVRERAPLVPAKKMGLESKMAMNAIWHNWTMTKHILYFT